MILFSNGVTCGNSADKTDQRGANVVRLGCGPEPYPRAFLYPTVALTSANALWGFAADWALLGYSGCSDWSDLCSDWLVSIPTHWTSAEIGQWLRCAGVTLHPCIYPRGFLFLIVTGMMGR